MPQEYSVPRLTDRQIIKAFDSAAKVKTPKHYTIGLVGGLNVSADEAKAHLGKGTGFLISSIHFQYVNLTVSFSRTVRKDVSISALDSISVRTGYEVGSNHDADSAPDALAADERFQVAKFIFDAFVITGVNRQPLSNEDEESARIESVHLNFLDKLEAAAAEQLTENQKHARELNTLFEKREQRLNADHERRIAELATQQQELERLRRELDDRDNTHVRRDLRKSINEHIQQNLRDFSFKYLRSKGISALHILYVLLISFFALLSIYFAIRLSSIPFDVGPGLNMNLLILGIKQSVSIAALVFVVSMYIRFLNQNVKRAADFEFMIRNFQLDIERASWAVETALEWRRHEGGQMPDALLTGVTKDLFKRYDRPDEPETSAADSLASALLGSAARAQVDLPFGKLEYDGKGIKKLEKDKPTQ